MMIRLSILVFFILILNAIASGAERQEYIVYMGEHSGTKTFDEIENIHHSYLHIVKGSREDAKASIIYSYKNAINGFSALLTPEEAEVLSEMDGVKSVFHTHPKSIRPHTTRSWDFINLLEANWVASSINGDDLLRKASYGKDITVGVIDSGVWPESASYNDEGMEAVPESWKGICQDGAAFNSSHCNRKLIGARYYIKSHEATHGPLDPNTDYRSARDVSGHGTHTSSTIGGRRVPNPETFADLGNGTVASGGAPLVRLAMYKVCWNIPSQDSTIERGCSAGDILAAFDDAISDGVQIISISIGGKATPYMQDPTAIGALHAVKQNIVVACSAGNSGPDPSTVGAVAPWIISVGASSIDRIFSAPVILGNGILVEGQSFTPIQNETYPLVYAGDVEIPGTTTNLTSGYCNSGTLSPSLVKGKAVFCWSDGNSKPLEVLRAGGVATILGNRADSGMEVSIEPYLIPATTVPSNETFNILNYIQTNQEPTATFIPPKVVTGIKPAPFMASFSSRGPNPIEPNILKPDVTAPGINILAAWTEESSPLRVPQDTLIAKYLLSSGTSMSCPHVAAVAALIKAIHPDWSSAAIRSALMTTAKRSNNLGNQITDYLGNSATPFEFGAGHIQPSKAVDPGLIYESSYEDYLLLLCENGTNSIDSSFKCPDVMPSASNLNYPSLAIGNVKGTMTIMRTVTNVGIGNSSYSVIINSPGGYSTQISPEKLFFSILGETQNFTITVQAETSVIKNVAAFGWYAWSDGTHQVQSPITLVTV